MHARKTWPSADGEILSATQQDDSDLSRKAGSVRARTRYWVEYEVGFAVPAAQCRTGMIYEGPAETLPCHGIVRTRSTQSTSRAFQWLTRGYHVNQQVKVLWDPAGTTSSDIKIAGESVWLRYNTDRLAISLLWVLVFGSLFVFSHSRVTYFKTHPEEDIWPKAESGSERGNRPPNIY